LGTDMMRIVPILFLILLTGLHLKGQDPLSYQLKSTNKVDVDSLERGLSAAPHDTNKVLILNQLFEEYRYSEPEKAKEYAEQALSYAQSAEYKKGIAVSMNNLGTYYHVSGNYEKALEHYIESRKISEELGDHLGISSSLNYIGIIYFMQEKPAVALKYLLRSLNMSRKIGNKQNEAISLIVIGNVYHVQENFDQAMEFFFEALKIQMENEDDRGVAMSYTVIARVYHTEGYYDKALEYQKKSLDITEALGDKIGMSVNHLGIGRSFKEQKKFDLALDYVERGLKYAREVKSRDLRKEAYKLYANIYYDKGDYRQAYKHYVTYAAINDTLIQDKNTESFEIMQSNLETEMNEQEITLLKQEADIQELVVKRQKIIKNSVIGGLVLVLILALVLYNRYRLKQKANALLGQQKVEIEQKSEKLEEVNKNLLAAKKNAEESERIKEQFLATMSHEIRTPMNAIVGFTKLVSKTDLTDEQKEFINNIKISGDHLLVIINDILDYYKIESGTITFEEVDFSLERVIISAADLHKHRADEAHTTLEWKIDKDIPDVVKGDPARFRQILLNLVSNAIKFTEKGTVTITADLIESKNGEATIDFSVKDSGIGIEEDKINLIFDRFTQAEADTTRKFGGTGLGLAIVKQLVELQDGSISVESKVGEGSVFKFTLSYRVSDVTVEDLYKEEEEHVIRPSLGKLNILLAEDNQMNQKLASKVLSDFGFEIEIAKNGEEALQKAGKSKFDVILMDIQMPKMDGYEATRKIRNELKSPKSDTPIIAMTAHVTNGIIQNCETVGMNDYISKPFEPNELYTKIAGVVKGKKASKAPAAKQSDETQKFSDGNDQKYIDLTYLEKLAAGSNEFMVDMIGDFIEKVPQDLDEIQSHLEDQNWKRVRAIAHKIKPTLGFMGIKKLEPVIASIEEFAAEEKSLEKLPGLIEELNSVCSLAVKELEVEISLRANKEA